MFKWLLIPLLLLSCTAQAAAIPADDSPWYMAGGGPGKENCTNLNFDTLELLWTFSPGLHVWEYRKRMSVWSESVVAGTVSGRPLLFCGSYDHNLYCLDARTGAKVWRFSTGLPINSSPLLIDSQNGTRVFVVSTDRVAYCLDAGTGSKIWSREIYPWTFTAFDGIFPSPISGSVGKRERIFLSAWYADNKPVRPEQAGVVFCLDPETGSTVWMKAVGKSPLYSPAFIKKGDGGCLYITSEDGNIYCFDAENGSLLWKHTTAVNMSSSPMVAATPQRRLYSGNLFGVYYALDADSGEEIWTCKMGMQCIYPGALTGLGGTVRLFVANFDRNLYCLDAREGTVLWKFQTGKYNASSPLLINFKGEQAVVFPSLDNSLYVVRASDGSRIWEYRMGERLWAYDTRGWTLWPSPVAVRLEGRALLLLPWYDGKIYAFSAGAG
ncbi:MAG: PQQ-like beta-propeller repeat protein [Candidatus Wallbacteria bacterium]|nr:PQQ-like beta-propeller repeat protein [Candidatus Wallbacteria bacterium]